jgi:pimeloyl-ACP methyl ester carboxylesterase
MSAALVPRERHVRASEIDFVVLEWGADDGPLALCLHGYPDTAWTWRHLGPHLAERGWRVAAPFMRGYRPTSLAPDGIYQIGALARDALELRRSLGSERPAVLIGHDWGAAAAYAAGSFAPEAFARIVTLAVPPAAALFAPLRSPARLLADLPLVVRQLRQSWYMLFQQFPGVSERALPRLVPRLWSDWSPGYDSREDIALTLAALRGEHATAALRYYRALLQPWARSSAYAAEEKHWTRTPPNPLLYLHGRDDGCLLAAIAERAADVLPAGSDVVIVPGAGHFLQLEQPDTVNARIEAFIGPSA